MHALQVAPQGVAARRHLNRVAALYILHQAQHVLGHLRLALLQVLLRQAVKARWRGLAHGGQHVYQHRLIFNDGRRRRRGGDLRMHHG